MAQSFINADDQKALGMDFLGGPVVKDSELPMGEFRGAWVPPLVRGLRSHVPPGGAIKENLWGTRGLLLLGQRPPYVETTQP